MALERLTRSDPLQLGRFRVLARIGGGGMGVVYLAEDERGQPAAVKVVKGELAGEDSFRARFRREVDAARRVDGRCTARFLDADTFAPAPWLATELVQGPTLHHEVHAQGPLRGARLVGLAAGLADALRSIHAAGLVHRDLKPANIILAPDAPKVIDFGVTMAADATALTNTGALVGSPAYMSPEQARGVPGDVGPAADVFSWASTVVFAATGTPPFGEGDAASVLYRVVHDEPDLADLDPHLRPFVAAALAKDASARPTPDALLGGLAVLASGSPAAALAVPGTGFVPPPPPSADGVLAATWRPPASVVPPVEATLLEARELRATVPRREAERRIAERRRANRAIFLSAVVAATALVLLALVLVRGAASDEVALSQARERDDAPTTVAAAEATGGGPTAPAAAPPSPPPSLQPVTPTTAPDSPAEPDARPAPPAPTPADEPSSPPTVDGPVMPGGAGTTAPGAVCTVAVSPAAPAYGASYTVSVTLRAPQQVTLAARRRTGPWAGSTAWSVTLTQSATRSFLLTHHRGDGPPPAASTTEDVEPVGVAVDITATGPRGTCATSYTSPAQPPA